MKQRGFLHASCARSATNFVPPPPFHSLPRSTPDSFLCRILLSNSIIFDSRILRNREAATGSEFQCHLRGRKQKKTCNLQRCAFTLAIDPIGRQLSKRSCRQAAYESRSHQNYNDSSASGYDTTSYLRHTTTNGRCCEVEITKVEIYSRREWCFSDALIRENYCYY